MSKLSSVSIFACLLVICYSFIVTKFLSTSFEDRLRNIESDREIDAFIAELRIYREVNRAFVDSQESANEFISKNWPGRPESINWNNEKKQFEVTYDVGSRRVTNWQIYGLTLGAFGIDRAYPKIIKRMIDSR